MKLSLALFIAGALMLGYDIAGHACCALARMTGTRGAELWNTYSTRIWPSISNSLHYDLHWTAWHTTALLFMALAYKLKS